MLMSVRAGRTSDLRNGCRRGNRSLQLPSRFAIAVGILAADFEANAYNDLPC
jgi:hypothetical protein